MIHKAHSDKIYDTAIIGGGVLGLWAARHAIKRGEKVVLIEKRKIGAGASGGFLGALMPHMPDNWNPKKQFQFEGLDTLETVVAELEEETGVSCGYRRCGRIMPITNEKLLGQIDRRNKGAGDNWQGKYNLSASSDISDQIINPEIAKFGLQHDTLSGRINPRQYLASLEAYVRPRCDLLEGNAVEALDMSATNGEITLSNGDKISAGKIIVASGYEAYPLLQPYMGAKNEHKSIGRGVKGQAVLLEYKHNDEMPIVYYDGSYIVPHKGNRVAIGSTSENVWEYANKFDQNNMDFYKRAIELVPALKDAPIIDRWASVRPRNTLEGRGTEPYFGAVEGHENLIAMLGGFKITLGVAHLDI